MAKPNKKQKYLEIEVIIRQKRYFKDGYGIYVVDLIRAEDELTNKVEENTMYTKRGHETVTIKGNFEKEFFSNEQYIMYGIPQYNEKYKTNEWQIVSFKNPINTPKQIKNFLMTCTSSESIVDQLVSKYGNEVVEKFADNTLDFSDIPGMGPSLYKKIRDKVIENVYMQDVIMELSQYDVTINQMRKIVEKFGASASKMIKDNPYLLCHIRGFGFAKADAIARNMEISEESEFRIRECIKYVLEKNSEIGNTWVDRSELIDLCFVHMKETCRRSKIVDIVDSIGEESENITYGLNEHVVNINGTRIALKKLYEAEKFIADWLLEKIEKNSDMKNIDINQFIEKTKNENPTITDEQLSLITNAYKNNVVLLIGYAGTGKTFATGIFLKMLKGQSVLLLAPTGE